MALPGRRATCYIGLAVLCGLFMSSCGKLPRPIIGASKAEGIHIQYSMYTFTYILFAKNTRLPPCIVMGGYVRLLVIVFLTRLQDAVVFVSWAWWLYIRETDEIYFWGLVIDPCCASSVPIRNSRGLSSILWVFCDHMEQPVRNMRA